MDGFLTIHDGDYTLNLSAIALIEWGEAEATVHLTIGGEPFTVEGDDLKALEKVFGRKRRKVKAIAAA